MMRNPDGPRYTGLGSPPFEPRFDRLWWAEDSSMVTATSAVASTLTQDAHRRRNSASTPNDVVEVTGVSIPYLNSELVEEWFFKYISTLDKDRDQNLGFIVLMATLPLYERYLKTVENSFDVNVLDRNNNPKYAQMVNRMMTDLGIENERDARAFWAMYRNGLSHAGMPLSVWPQNTPTHATMLSPRHEPILTGNAEADDGITYRLFVVSPIRLAQRIAQVLRNHPEIWDLHPNTLFQVTRFDMDETNE